MALTFYCSAGSLALRERIPARINAWMQGIEILPFFPKTWPAHWK